MKAQMHDASYFFTLTYDDENVPADYSVKLSDWQKFIRRTRKRIGFKSAVRRKAVSMASLV